MQAPGTTAPLFIGGLCRSGTSLLRCMIGQHSAFFSGLETHWFGMDWQAGPQGGVAERNETLEERLDLLQQLFEVQPDDMARIIKESRSATHFLNRFMSYCTSRAGKRRWVEKTPGNVFHLVTIHAAWEHAGFIHVVRDPRDVFASFKGSKTYHTPELFAPHWCRFLGASHKAREHYKSDDKWFMDVRYEQLVFQPVSVMKGVIDFVGEGWEEAAGRFDGNAHDVEVVRKVLGWEGPTTSRLGTPLLTDRVGIWKKQTTPKEINRIREMVADQGLLSYFDAMIEQTEADLLAIGQRADA
ncbi:MAG: sulfotransferase [Magnetococcales bacterium]|nr:sulfotransferase [Magnetococcales bacterium]